MMSNKKLLIILSLVVIVLIGSGIVYYDKHSKKVSNESKPTSSSNIASKNDIKTAQPNSTSTKSDSKADNSKKSTDKSQSQNQVNPADDEEQDDISYISYTVKANDTVWKIAKENMPDYSLTDKDGKIGVVTYIVNKNNLKKIGNNAYSVYVGQKLTIPTEKPHNIVNH